MSSVDKAEHKKLTEQCANYVIINAAASYFALQIFIFSLSFSFSTSTTVAVDGR